MATTPFVKRNTKREVDFGCWMRKLDYLKRMKKSLFCSDKEGLKIIRARARIKCKESFNFNNYLLRGGYNNGGKTFSR